LENHGPPEYQAEVPTPTKCYNVKEKGRNKKEKRRNSLKDIKNKKRKPKKA